MTDNVFIRIKDTSLEKLFKKDIVSLNELIEELEEEMLEIDQLNEKIEDIEEDIKENYRPLTMAEQIGIRDRDFY